MAQGHQLAGDPDGRRIELWITVAVVLGKSFTTALVFL